MFQDVSLFVWCIVGLSVLIIIRDIIVHLVQWRHDRRLKAIMHKIDQRQRVNDAILSGLLNGNILDLGDDDL
jgi:heme exporter protein D